MDYDLTRLMIDHGFLPNIKSLAERGSLTPLLSVFPADSIPSWITTYTGLDPSEHGIIDHVNYLLGDQDEAKIDTTIFHGKTFWDRIGTEANSKVCVINPFMAYPVWSVNGVMVNGPSFITGDIQVSNPSGVGGLEIPSSIGGLEDLPGKSTMKPFLEKAITDTRKEAAFGLAMLEKNQPALFFQTFLTSDRVQHFLWRYCDSSDPTYPGRNDIEDGLEKFFKVIDSIVGNYLEKLDEDDILLIMSDHGHGMRCTHCFNFNEYLRRKGYLQESSSGKRFSKKVVIEILKNKVLKFMNDNNFEDYISKVAKLVPNAKELKRGTYLADFSNSMAYAPDFAGTNPGGGVCINRNQVENYEKFRADLMREMSELTYEDQPVFRWIRPREQLYKGSYIDRYPDILYEMVPQLGTGFSLHTDIFTVNPTHKKISGGHKKYGVFLNIGPGDWDVTEKECKITNIHETLLSLFSLKSGHENRIPFLSRRN
jgi:predicted AlkP superfamily phosphohydrolase/phosphomutase